MTTATARRTRQEMTPEAILAERAEAVLLARAESERVAKMLDEVETAFETQARATGLTTVEFEDGTKVTAVLDAERRSVDTEALRELVSAPTFRLVTKAVADLSKFDAAIEVGRIPATVVKAVVKTTKYDQTRVTKG